MLVGGGDGDACTEERMGERTNLLELLVFEVGWKGRDGKSNDRGPSVTHQNHASSSLEEYEGVDPLTPSTPNSPGCHQRKTGAKKAPSPSLSLSTKAQTPDLGVEETRARLW